MILSYKNKLHDIKRLAWAFWGNPFINYIKILIAFYVSRITKKIFTPPLPFAFSVEVSAKCNLKCPECSIGMGKTKRTNKFLDITIYDNLLKQTKNKSFYINLYFQGEPFLNHRIFDFIEKARAKNFYSVISTNGHFLDEKNNQNIIQSGLNRLIVSLDGISAKTYTSYRKNGDFENVIEGIKNLTKQKNTLKATHPYIILQFLVQRKNEHELKHLKSFAKNLGVDSVVTKTMQFANYETIEKLSPSLEKYRRYRKTSDGIWQIKKQKRRVCFRLWSQIVVTADGDVVPCCYDKLPEHIAGNVKDKSIKEIWSCDKLNIMRKNLLYNANVPDICRNCYG